jgi:hypothetical protein
MQYWNDPSRSRRLNVTSLEITGTELAKLTQTAVSKANKRRLERRSIVSLALWPQLAASSVHSAALHGPRCIGCAHTWPHKPQELTHMLLH